MEVEIYLDSLFVLNLMINIWILELICKKFTLKANLLRVFGASFVGAGSYIALFFLPGKSWFIQPIGIVVSLLIMVCVLLPKRKRRFFWKAIGMGLFYSFIIAGILRAVLVKWKVFTGNEITISAVLLGAFACLKLGRWCIEKHRHFGQKNMYKVHIKSAGKTIHVTALLDTGNSLKEPISGKPVCLIEEELLAHITLENQLFLRAIPYRSVGCERGMLYGVEIPRVEIFTDGAYFAADNIICAGVGHKLSTKGAYQMILHPALLTEENRGSERKE